MFESSFSLLSLSPNKTLKENSAHFANYPADYRQVRPPNVARYYGAVEYEADINVDEMDDESRGSHEEQ